MLKRVFSPLFYIIACLTLLTGVGFRLAHADSPAVPDWFAQVTPAATKVNDLAGGVQPQMSNLDCTPQMLDVIQTTSDDGTAVDDCTVDSPIGPITTSSRIITTSNKAYNLVGAANRSVVMPVPNSGLVSELIPSSTSTGSYIGFYNALTRSDVVKENVNNYTYTTVDYRLTKAPDYLLKSGSNSLAINPQIMAYSKNGRWMVVDLPRSALLRVNLDTMQITPFAGSSEPSWNLGLNSQAVAISDDGRYVALGGGSFNAPTLGLYDLSTCSGSIPTTSLPGAAYCKTRDIWKGQFVTTGQGSDMGIGSELPAISQIGNLRFVDDGNISFNALYDQVSTGSGFRAATFLVTANGAVQHNLGLLGEGDSYISGEGEQQYVDGTDTDVNKCHLSKLAYPYLLGNLYFGSYQSVACSGAKTTDISNYHKDYAGQVKDGQKQGDRDADKILSQFAPGYIYQDSFAETYKPEAILLSIGGNNIGFTDIIKSCVQGLGDQATCYATYQQRLSLLNTINASFGDLVKTYDDVKTASPASRVYVVGYPQIIKPDGDCGDNVHLNAAETQFAGELITDLDNVIQKAATKSGVYYVDTQNAFDGYRLCEGAPGDSAVNGLTVGNDVAIPVLSQILQRKLIANESYHPTQLGHQLLSSAIAAATDKLTAPMPVPQPSVTAPTVSSSDPLLANLPPVSGNPLAVIADNNITADNYVAKGATVALDAEGVLDNLAPYTPFDIVLHSDPIDLGSVTSGANGDIDTTITIPTNLPTGLHAINLYGKDFAGNDVDIQKQIYVVDPSAPAYGGYCQVVPDSGVDVDQDGIDDACDPVIGPAPVVQPPNNSDQSGNQTSGTGVSTSQPADPQQPAEGTNGLTQTNTGSGKVTSSSGASLVLAAAKAQVIAGVTPSFGGNSVSPAIAPTNNILGDTTAAAANQITSGERTYHRANMLWKFTIPVALAAIIIATILARRRTGNLR